MALLRVLLGFASAPDHELEETTGHILTSLYGNVVYPSPPVTAADLQAALTAFTNAVAVQAQGGTAATAAKKQAAQTLIGLLRQLALYVQTTIQSNAAYGLAELLSNGFDAASTSRAQSPLDTPTIIGIDKHGHRPTDLARDARGKRAVCTKRRAKPCPTPPPARARSAIG